MKKTYKILILLAIMVGVFVNTVFGLPNGSPGATHTVTIISNDEASNNYINDVKNVVKSGGPAQIEAPTAQYTYNAYTDNETVSNEVMAEKLNEMLRGMKLVWPTKSGVTVSKDYETNKSNKEGTEVILQSYIPQNSLGDLLDNKREYLNPLRKAFSDEGIDNAYSIVYVQSEGAGSSESTVQTSSKLILRVYGFSCVPGIDWTPGLNAPASYSDTDITGLLISARDSGADLSKYKTVEYLVGKLNEKATNDTAKTKGIQEKLWEEYDKSSSTATAKPQLNDVGMSKLNDKKYTTAKSSNAIDNLMLGAYVHALKTSGAYSYDYSEYGVDAKLADSYGGIKAGEGRTYSVLDCVKYANEISASYEEKSSIFTTPSLDSNATIFDDLVKYRFGLLSNANYRGTGSTAADEVQKSDRLESVLLKEADLKGVAINPVILDLMASKMKLPENYVKSTELMGLVAQLQYLEEYAKPGVAASGLEWTDDSKTKFNNPKLETYLSKQKEGEDYAIVEDQLLTTQLKAYKAIKNGLIFLGIDPWNEYLKYICNIKNIDKIPLNESLDSGYQLESDSEALRVFFTLEEQKFSNYYLTGIAESATYIPMKTNLYDPTSIRYLEDQAWLTDFHIKYGFHRKALMMDTNVNAAVDGYITGNVDNLRVTTLRDLLQPEQDLVLYIDDNFYNTDDIAELIDLKYNKLINTEQSGSTTSTTGKVENVADLFQPNAEDVLKTGGSIKYDDSMIKNVKQYGDTTTTWSWSDFKEKLLFDGIVMKGPSKDEPNEIKDYMTTNDYTPRQSYAVVSGIYRQQELANFMNVTAEDITPVFVSSPRLYAVSGIGEQEFNSIYNYYMLKNLESVVGVDYSSTVDLDNPVYMDIYGNIVTESGLVVIPAASNASLYPGDKYTPHTMGFIELYSKGEYIETTNEEVKTYLEKWFTYDEESKKWLLKNYEINGVPLDPLTPSVSDVALIQALYQTQVVTLNAEGYDFRHRVWLLVEALRGAPVEFIDKDKEGLVGNRAVSKQGLFMSWKLDELADLLLPTLNGNSLISMPNLAFMPGLEYIILFIYKAVMILIVVYILYKIYTDAVGGKIGWQTVGGCILTAVIVIASISLIPKTLQLSYNEPNRIFLQSEVKYLNMLNYEKNQEGREISAVGVDTPKSQTKLYLKIDELDLPWYDIIDDVLFSSITLKLSDIYEKSLMESSMYGYPGVEVVNDGAYMSVDDIFLSSSIKYNKQYSILYQDMNENTTISYFMPYYFIMDGLLANMNVYNKENGILNVVTKVQSNGEVKTTGMIGSYLLSEHFMVDAEDPLGLYKLYNIDTLEADDSTDVLKLDGAKESMWFVPEAYEPDDVNKKIAEVYSYMRAYVANNREMIGRVTDDTFIKTMMMDVSIKYNDVFRIPAGRSIEVFNIDSRDLIRLSVTDKNTAIVNCSYSFGRFIYSQGGTLAVILTALLIGVFAVLSVVRPALVIFLVILLIYNLLIKSIMKGDKSQTVQGMLITMAILMVINGLYAILLKLSLSLPELGSNIIVSIIGQIIIQLVYMFLLFKVVMILVHDPANYGYGTYGAYVQRALGGISGIGDSISSRFLYNGTQRAYRNQGIHMNGVLGRNYRRYDNYDPYEYNDRDISLRDRLRQRDSRISRSSERDAYRSRNNRRNRQNDRTDDPFEYIDSDY